MRTLAAIGADIKLSHSVFAMPFALLATFIAADGWPGWAPLALIVVCMFFARTFAMLANRYVDRAIDADNPRTAGRALPVGRLTPRAVVTALAACGLTFVVCTIGFGLLDGNWYPVMLSPLVLGWLYAYGLFKRFTALCHVFLGSALAISPLAAALAIEPTALGQPTLWLIAGFVMLWVAGFDVIYALQDLAFDQQAGLHSIPTALGKPGALLVARVMHAVAFGLLFRIYMIDTRFEAIYLVGVGIVGVLLVVEHIAAARGKFSMAFFTLNGVISLVLGGLGIADILL